MTVIGAIAKVATNLGEGKMAGDGAGNRSGLKELTSLDYRKSGSLKEERRRALSCPAIVIRDPSNLPTDPSATDSKTHFMPVITVEGQNPLKFEDKHDPRFRSQYTQP